MYIFKKIAVEYTYQGIATIHTTLTISQGQDDKVAQPHTECSRTNDSCHTSPTLICNKHAHFKPCVAANITDLHGEISPHKTDE